MPTSSKELIEGIKKGDTALHWAAENGHKDIVKLLLEKRENKQ